MCQTAFAPAIAHDVRLAQPTRNLAAGVHPWISRGAGVPRQDGKASKWAPVAALVGGVCAGQQAAGWARRRGARPARRATARSAAAAAERPRATLVDGKCADGPDLSVVVNGLKFPNPFIIGSGPPGTNYQVMKRAFDEGWGGVICKTLSLDNSKVHNVTPRYAKLKVGGEVVGFENIELVSDLPFEKMLEDLSRLKQEYPDRILIASVMEEYNRDAWIEIIQRCEEAGVDAFELNFSCPHGMPERRMGMAMGQDCELLEEVCRWVDEAATVPAWAKMTPNVTDIVLPARTALAAGLEGISAINTINSVMGVNLKTLRPEPCVAGYSTPGGYSSKAVKPIALAKVMSIAREIEEHHAGGGRSLSGLGGIDSGHDAAEFILLGADTVQVCTGVMLRGYPLVKTLCGELQAFMAEHGFESISQFRGASLPYFTKHSDLFRRQQEAKAKRKGILGDAQWTGDGFVQETESMVSNS